jgi:hypothetical protein
VEIASDSSPISRATRCATSTALAELSRRRVPRYQVHDDNKPSILLAESVGLTRFLTITHFLHLPNQG